MQLNGKAACPFSVFLYGGWGVILGSCFSEHWICCVTGKGSLSLLQASGSGMKYDMIWFAGRVYLGILGPSSPGVANSLGSDTCADDGRHAFRDTALHVRYRGLNGLQR